jgi:hypothetical protein
VASLTGAEVELQGDSVTVATDEARSRWVAEVAAYAHGWRVAHVDPSSVLLRPGAP